MCRIYHFGEVSFSWWNFPPDFPPNHFSVLVLKILKFQSTQVQICIFTHREPVYYNSRICLLHIESLSNVTMFFANHFSVSKSFATANHFGEVLFSWWNFFRAKNGPRIILVKDHFSVEKLYLGFKKRGLFTLVVKIFMTKIYS